LVKKEEFSISFNALINESYAKINEGAAKIDE
jgi:hypothetical protein